MSVRRFEPAGSVLVATCLLVHAASAEPPPSSAECLAAYSDGQRARKTGEFAKAHELFAFCGGATCPNALHGDCQRWLSEVEAVTPTSVFQVLGAGDNELTDVRLQVGGNTHALDGRAIAFDAGEHELRFFAAGHETLTQRVTFTEGEKLTFRKVHLQPTSKAAPVSEGASPSPAEQNAFADAPAPEDEVSYLPVLIGAGLGAVGVAGFSYFGLRARGADKDLSICAPGCSTSRVEGIERDYLLANVSLGVGVVGVLGAITWLVFGSSGDTATGDNDFELKVSTQSAALTGRF
jgi:hypothetical protein